MDAAGARALKRRIEQYQAQRRVGLTGPSTGGDAADESSRPEASTIPETMTPLEAWIAAGGEPGSASA